MTTHDTKRVQTLESLCERAWTIIANVSEGNWSKQGETWQQAARRWADDWHKERPA